MPKSVGPEHACRLGFDVKATGNTGFATLYLDTQRTLADSTAVSVTDDADPSQVGEWVAFTAYVAANSTTFAGFPSGTVQFNVDGSNVGEPIKVDAKGRAMWQTSHLQGSRNIGWRPGTFPAQTASFCPARASKSFTWLNAAIAASSVTNR